MPDSVSQDDVSTLVERLEDAAWAYMRGDMERYLELVHPSGTRWRPARQL
jgi:hypothetical protein